MPKPTRLIKPPAATSGTHVFMRSLCAEHVNEVGAFLVIGYDMVWKTTWTAICLILARGGWRGSRIGGPTSKMHLFRSEYPFPKRIFQSVNIALG